MDFYTSVARLYYLASDNPKFAKDVYNIIKLFDDTGKKYIAEVVRDTIFVIADVPTCRMYKLIQQNPDLDVDSFIRRYTQVASEVGRISLRPLPFFASAMSLRDIQVSLPRWFGELKRKINE